LEQCLEIIISTAKGSDPLRPLFGCDAWKYLDKPASIAVPAIIAEMLSAIAIWEKRVKVTAIALQSFNSEGGLKFVITYVRQGASQQSNAIIEISA
jgi:phage baseplate assembly protein W